MNEPQKNRVGSGIVVDGISVDTIRCPNHGEPLLLDKDQKTAKKGSSPCPVSMVMFEWTQDPNIKGNATKFDKYGNAVSTWTVTGHD